MMRVPLAAGIAFRFLRAKKSHSAVSAISMVSVCGIAVATAAIVCVLSVFNGFREVIGGRLDTLAPDIVITPARGKSLAAPDSLLDLARTFPEVALATPTLADNALIIAEGREMPVMLKGVDPEEWRKVTEVEGTLMREVESRYPASGDEGLVSIGVASRTGAFTGRNILIFAPRRTGRVNPANPAASFVTDSASVSGIFRTDQEEYDENMVIVPISTARHLFGRPGGASAIEIKLREGSDGTAMAAKIADRVGSDYAVKDRDRQREANFRMINIEKWVSFLLLFFILVIASFNIISSLGILVLEKRDSLGMFRALGMTRRATGRIFAWESMMVTAIGGAAGIAIGVILTLIQQYWAPISIDTGAGSMPYPVRLLAGDLLLTLLPVGVIGIAAAEVTARYARGLAGALKN